MKQPETGRQRVGRAGPVGLEAAHHVPDALGEQVVLAEEVGVEGLAADVRAIGDLANADRVVPLDVHQLGQGIDEQLSVRWVRRSVPSWGIWAPFSAAFPGDFPDRFVRVSGTGRLSRSVA